jgi:multiple sugar transport system permease protein
MSMVGQTKQISLASDRARAIRRSRRGKFIRQMLNHALVYALLIFGAVIFMAPFLWMLGTSLKDPKHIFVFPPQLIPNPVRFSNYPEAWARLPFTQFAWNTIKITLHNAVVDTLVSSLVAYSFARLRAPGKDFLFILVLATMMVPYEITLVPLYIVWSRLKLVNTFAPLMVPSWFAWPMFVFLLRQFIATIPYDLDDAARIDGCSTFGIWWRIILPLCKPALAAVAVFSFVGNWNDFQGPLIYLSDMSKYTLALGLHMLQGGRFIFIHHVMALSVIIVTPILIVFFSAQRYFIQGVTLSGITGR